MPPTRTRLAVRARIPSARTSSRTASGPLEELPTVIIPDEEEQMALKAAWDEAPQPSRR